MSSTTVKPSAIFWILGIIFLLWNLMGCGVYLNEAFNPNDAYAEIYPAWATAAYAIAVWGGLVAAILFLLRKRLSAGLFVLSLVAALICFIPYLTSEALRAVGGSSFWVMPLIVVLIGILEVWFSRLQRAKGVLR